MNTGTHSMSRLWPLCSWNWRATRKQKAYITWVPRTPFPGSRSEGRLPMCSAMHRAWSRHRSSRRRDALPAAGTNFCARTRSPASAALQYLRANPPFGGLRMQLPKAVHELEYNHGSVYGEEEQSALLQVLAAGAPSCGPRVKAFEEAFAAYCDAPYGLAVTSAT